MISSYKYLQFILFSILCVGIGFNFIYSDSITSCISDLDSTYWDKTLYLQNDINNWDAYCFNLQDNFEGHFLIIDLNGHNVISGENSSNFLYVDKNIDYVSITNGDVILEDSSSEFVVLNDNGAVVNNLNFLDLNVINEDYAFLRINSFNSSDLDLNFSDSNFTSTKELILIVDSNISNLNIVNLDLNLYKPSIGAVVDFIYFNTSNIGNLNILDSFFDISQSGFIYYSNTDLNSISVLNTNIIHNNNYFILLNSGLNEYLDINFFNTNFVFEDICDLVVLKYPINLTISNFYGNHDAITIYNAYLYLHQDRSIEFTLDDSNILVNTYLNLSGNNQKDYNIVLNDVNLFLSDKLFSYGNQVLLNSLNIYNLNYDSIENKTIFPYFYDLNIFTINNSDINLLNLTTNLIYSFGDINSIFFKDSNLYLDNSNLINFPNPISLSLTFDNVFANKLNFSESVFNLNYLDSNQAFFTIKNDSDINEINFLNVDFNFKSILDNMFYFENLSDSYLDLNFYNSSIDIYDVNNLFYFLNTNLSHVGIIDFNVINNSNPKNIIYLEDSNIFNFTLQDSVLFVDSVLSVDENSNLDALVYNNIFYDYNLDNPFVFNYGNLNIDFNTALQEDNTKRELIISDDYNNIGGNLWLDSNANYSCVYDYDEDGICDSNMQILFSDLSYGYDYYPLIEDSFDLNVYDISLSSTRAGAITVTCSFGNLGKLATEDYNVLFYVNNVLQNTNNLTNLFLPQDVNSTTFSWSPSTGTYSLKCSIDSDLSDINESNNTYTKSFTITSGTVGPGETKTYDLSSNFSLSNTNLSKNSNIILSPSISKSGTATFGSAEYKIYFYNDSNTKVELFEYDFSDSGLPLTNTHTLTLDNLLSYGEILDLVNAQGKINLYLEVSSSDDTKATNNISQKLITIDYLEVNLSDIYLNGEILSSDLNLNLEDDYNFTFGLDYLVINSNKNVTLNFRTNKRLAYTKTKSISGVVLEETFSDSITLNLLDFVNEAKAKELILNLFNFDLTNEIHRQRYMDILDDLGIIYDGDSFADEEYYLEVNILGQDYSNSSNNKLNIGFYSSFVYDSEDLELVDKNKPVSSVNTDSKESNVQEKINYYLKYKSVIGIDENQIIFLYDDKNNFVSNTDVIIKFNDDLFFFKTDSLGNLYYNPENVGTYFIDVKKLGLKGSFEVLDDYVSSDSDYIIFENSVLFGESQKTSILVYFIIIFGIVVLSIIGAYFFYPRKPKTEGHDFILTDNYLKSEFFEKSQLEKDIMLAKRGERILEKKIIKKELELAKKEESLLEQKISNNKRYRFRAKIIKINKEDKILENKLKQKTGYDL